MLGLQRVTKCIRANDVDVILDWSVFSRLGTQDFQRKSKTRTFQTFRIVAEFDHRVETEVSNGSNASPVAPKRASNLAMNGPAAVALDFCTSTKSDVRLPG